MLIEFRVGNYRSFKEPVTLSMEAANITAKDKDLDEQNRFPVDEHGKLHLLKSAVIYGANASGKSNLIAALDFMRRFVLGSATERQAGDPIRVEPFRLSTETRAEPSLFEIVFRSQGRQYRYGFEVTPERVVAEWLYHVPNVREARLFERDGDAITLARGFKEGRDIPEKTRPNALFLSVVAQFNGEIAKQLLKWFGQLGILRSGSLSHHMYNRYTIKCLKENRNRDDIIRLIQQLDLDIQNIHIETNTISHRVKTSHQVYDTDKPVTLEAFDMDEHESDGTQKLFAMAGPLVDTLKNGEILIVDELDTSMHPLMVCELVDLFHSDETNPHNAQLIFTTHDTNLLDKQRFRRDQVWFTEKNRRGATALFSLVEYKIRNDASFESNYIRGRYGAIPFLGNIQRVIEALHDGDLIDE